MTNEQLQEAVAEIVQNLPNIHRAAYNIGVSHVTVRTYRRRLPKQVTVLNDLLREVGMELTIVETQAN